MRQRRASSSQPPELPEFLAFENVTIRKGDVAVFAHTQWTWREGEQWALLGPDGSGKSVFIEAILGVAPVVAGDLRGPSASRGRDESSASPATAQVSPQTHRELAAQESSFHQLRWHSGIAQGQRTVAQFLSPDSVEDRNPFQVDPPRGNRRRFFRERRQWLEWLGLRPWWRRRLVHLSNGELRKVLLTHALLKRPRLLVLEDAFAGLDTATRRALLRVTSRLMRDGWRILVATHREEELPAATTHVLLMDGHRVIAQGPKRPMLALWRRRFGVRRIGAVAVPPPDTRPRRTSGEPLVELRRVTVTGSGRKLLREVTWTWRDGECWALLGPNGAGKTTLLSLIQGDHPQVWSLDIRLLGRGLNTPHGLPRARHWIGALSPELHQHYPAECDVADVVASGFFNSVGLHRRCARWQRVAVRRWLFNLGLARHARQALGGLSFGQQRLVLLARAVVKQPRLLILDEPCQGLDALQRQTLFSAVDRVVAQTGANLLLVTHHANELPRCVTHVLRLAGGEIREARPLR